MNLPIILASSSIFRQEQLSRLQLPFQAQKPFCDETPKPNESPDILSIRLAEQKAISLSEHFQAALIIGSDQVAICQGRILKKPLNLCNAKHHLTYISAQEVHFYTGLVLLNSKNGNIHRHIDHTIVSMRDLSEKQIDRYLEREADAIYCAGSIKSEGLGMSLISNIKSDDPNALIGLPIFRLVDFLQQEGVSL